MTGLTLSAEGQAATVAVDAEEKFRRLVRQWRKETRHQSSITTICTNPAYQKIIGMGKTALPFILSDLQRTQDHWLWALDAIVDEDPAAGSEDSNEAIAAWLKWGKRHGYLS